MSDALGIGVTAPRYGDPMSSQAVSHSWSPITGLTEADLLAASDELPALVATWLEERERLDPAQVEQFNERLQREWAIETGIIERIYSLDRGTTQLLIEQGIDASLIGHDETDQSPEFVAAIISDQQSAVNWLFTVVTQQRPLSTSFVKELHALMTGRQAHADAVDQFGKAVKVSLLHGEYKQLPNNPTRADGSVHEYCPPEQVSAEMDRLIELHLIHQEQGVLPEIEAAWLHHRFTQIHPFQDGNGRVARALASLVLICDSWFPLVVTRDDRSRYIDALEAADAGDLAPLVQVFVAIEKRSFVKALSIAEQVQREAVRVDQMIDAIGTMFGERDRQVRLEWDQAKRTAHGLWETTVARLDEVKQALDGRIVSPGSGRRTWIDYGDDADEKRRLWHRYQVVSTASGINYYANVREFHEWTRLGFETENGRSEMLVSFHAIGQDYRGLVGASVCFYRRQEADDIEHQIIELQPISDDLFQVNYKEDPASVVRRFRPWLEDNIVRGLDQWRRGE